MVGFYELQLIVLVSLCLIFILLERHVSRRKESKEKDLHTAERLENGEPTASHNSLATLTRQYLIVYAIVMGMYHSRSWESRDHKPIQVLIGSRDHMCTHCTENSMVSRKGWLQSSLSQVSCPRGSLHPWWESGQISSTLHMSLLPL
jgi:hypothetical protein